MKALYILLGLSFGCQSCEVPSLEVGQIWEECEEEVNPFNDSSCSKLQIVDIKGGYIKSKTIPEGYEYTQEKWLFYNKAKLIKPIGPNEETL